MLASVAQSHLDDGADHKEVLKAATEAVAICYEMGDKDAMADMLRLVLKAYLLKADIVRHDKRSGSQNVVAETLKKAEHIAQAELVLFRQAGCVRGQAMMLLSTADILLEKQAGGKTSVRALEAAAEARALFEKLGDKKLEAIALLTLVTAYGANREKHKALEAGLKAEALFRDIGDKPGVAKSLHAVALAQIVADTYAAYTDALQSAKEALVLFEELGLKRSQANELLTIAVLNLERDSPEQAIPPAKQALELFRQIGRDNGAQSVALSTLVQAHSAREEDIQALQEAKEGLAWIQNTGDKRQEVIIQDMLAHVQLKISEADEALSTTREALATCKDLGDPELEARMLLTLCQVYMKQHQPERALKTTKDAIGLLSTLTGAGHMLASAHHMCADVHCSMKSYTEALEAAQRSRDCFAEVEDLSSEAKLMLLIAGLSGEREALEMAKQAQDVFRMLGEKRLECLALSAIADLHCSSKSYEQALEAATHRRTLLQEAGFRKEEAKSLHAMANVHQASGDTPQALRAAREGMRMARAEGDKATEVHMSMLLVQASVTLLADTPENDSKTLRTTSEEAMKVSRDTVALAKKVCRGQLKAHAFYWQGQFLLAMNDPDAMGAASEALSNFKRDGNRLGEGHALLLSAQCSMSQGNHPKADEYAQSALAVFTECDDLDGKAMVQGLMGQQRPVDAVFYQPMMQPLSDGASMGRVEVTKTGPDPLVVRNKIRQLVLDALDSDEVSLDTPLMDSGLDSLASVSFRNEVSKEFNTTLPASLIFDYPTISGLTTYMVELLDNQ